MANESFVPLLRFTPEQHDLERQQQDLFDELAREQAEAEQALPPNQEGSIEVSSPGKIG